MNWIFKPATGSFRLDRGHWQARVWQDTDGYWQAHVYDGPAATFSASFPTLETAQAWAEATILHLEEARRSRTVGD
jgi:hypothetical protein